MNFIVYKPEEEQREPSPPLDPTASPERYTRNSPMNATELEDWSKYRKISFDLTPKTEEKKEDMNISI